MTWFNPYGLAFMAVIMIPNIIFAIKCRDGFANPWSNKAVEALEQIGRYGCFATMIFNIPYTAIGFWSENAFAVYLIADTVMTAAYCIIWVVCFRKNSLFRAISLSVIPSVIFLFSGIMSRSVLLTLSALIFAPCHIMISVKNCILQNTNND
ncbi:MAG: hypothetical protein ACI4JF_05110 [Oscillospiraceae bacterium]